MSSKKMQYISKGETVDGTSYCSGVETLADNIIEDNEQDAVLIYPSKTDWAVGRATDYRLTTENAEMHLPYPIYKIKRVLLKPAVDVVSFLSQKTDETYVSVEASVADFKNSANESFVLDITDMVVSKDEWGALRLAQTLYEYMHNVCKDNALYWEKGGTSIQILNTIYENKIAGAPGAPSDSPVWYRLLLRTETLLEERIGEYVYNYELDGQNKSITLKEIAEGLGESANYYVPYDVREWQFRIEYIPMTSKTKIRARKNAQTKVDYIQPFNQRAEINAASAFGKNMWLTAQKTGCREIKLVKNYTSLADIPPLGALVMHNGKRYRLVANHYTQTNTIYLQVTHTLSENWSKKSEHVSVDQKYRNWTIPQDTLWRNLYWEDYLRVGTSLKKGADVNCSVALADITQGLFVDSTNDKTVHVFSLEGQEALQEIKNEEGTVTAQVMGATLPCSTYGIAHSLIFSASFKDNLSAGLRYSLTQASEYFCEEALYCKSDGTLNTAKITLSSSYGVNDVSGDLAENFAPLMDETAQQVYPSVLKYEVFNGGQSKFIATLNAPINPVFEETFSIDKDPGEALKFTYQIHLIGEDNCLFGNKFAEHNPLIKDYNGAQRTFKVWLLKRYIRDGVDILETTANDTVYEHTYDNVTNMGAKFELYELSQSQEQLQTYGKAYKLNLLGTVTNALRNGDYKAWAVTDENNNLYVGCNDASVKTVYFQLHHKR